MIKNNICLKCNIPHKPSLYYQSSVDSCLAKHNIIKQTPMKHFFTSEEMRPSEKTINLIKQIAYSYRAIKLNGRYEAYCLN